MDSMSTTRTSGCMGGRNKRAKTVGAAAAIALPDELVIEILSRLPTTPLARFQCVSKAWRSLISSVRILHPPLSGFFFYPAVLFRRGSYASLTPRDDFPSRLAALPFNSTFHLTHSCNGLLLLTRTHLTNTSLYYVWNPTTMQLVALPERLRFDYACCYLAFDPRRSPHYSAVRFTLTHCSTRLIVEIYSSSTGTWLDPFTVPIQEPTVSLHEWDCGSVYHQGALHFLATHHLVSFHMETKCFRSLILPKDRPSAPGRQSTTTCIGESNGQLYYAVCLPRPSQLHIYTLLHGKDEWLLTRKINTQFIDHHPLTCDPDSETPPTHYLQPIAFHPESEVVYLSLRSKILSYRPSSAKLEELYKLPARKASFHWTHVFSIIPCVESIHPPGATFIKPFDLENITSGG